MIIPTEHTLVAIAMCLGLGLGVFRTRSADLGIVGLIVIAIFWGVTG